MKCFLRRWLFLPLLTGIALLPAGCLPPGDPPAGKIVDNPVGGTEKEEPLPFARARKKALNDLIQVFMLHCSGQEVCPQGDEKTDRVIRQMARESGVFSGTKVVAPPAPEACQLHSEIQEKRWKISLFSPKGKRIWAKEYPLAEE